MGNKKVGEKQWILRLAIVIGSLGLFLSRNLYFYYIKFPGWTLTLTLFLELLLYLSALIGVIILFIRFVRREKWRNKANYISLGIVVLIFLNFNFGWFRADRDTFQSKVIEYACYEGVVYQANLMLRENGTFECFDVGFFAHLGYSDGLWNKKGDTLFLSFTNEFTTLLSDTTLIKNGYLHPVKKDSIGRGAFFLGPCKGEY